MVIGSTRKTPLGKAAALYFRWIELSHSEIKVYTILGEMKPVFLSASDKSLWTSTGVCEAPVYRKMKIAA